MKKRTFLQTILFGSTAGLGSLYLLKKEKTKPADFTSSPSPSPSPTPSSTPSSSPSEPGQITLATKEEAEIILAAEKDISLDPAFKHIEREPDLTFLEETDVDSYLEKIRNFDGNFDSDIYLSDEKKKILDSTLEGLKRIELYVGHGNYNVLDFDTMLFYARNYAPIGRFSQEELDFLEEIFSADATEYGFFGEKVTPNISHTISAQDAAVIPGSAHYLLKGESYNYYQQIHKDVGNELLLTSGLRNIVKQMHLFLAKAQQSNYNLSKASRSLAPPGYSFHGIGDFDVGKIGLGEKNFTADFSQTDEFKRMISLGYIDIRYTDTNEFGVRYEPWHIKTS